VFTESLHCIVSCASLFQFITCFTKIDIYFLLFQEETPDEDETFNVVYSLKKVATFYNCHNLGNWGIWDSIFKDISDAKDGNKALPEEVNFSLQLCPIRCATQDTLPLPENTV